MNDNDKKRSELIAKALKDPAFKAELLKNPGAAIAKATGVQVPAGVTVKVVEDSASVVHLVLPVVTAAKSGELSDADLQGVAGGAGPSTQFRMCMASSSNPGGGTCVG